MRKIIYKKPASRALRRMPSNTAKTIRNKIRSYAANPQSQQNNVKDLKGSPYKRLRVGNWRVIFREEGDDLIIEDIGPRGGIYQP